MPFVTNWDKACVDVVDEQCHWCCCIEIVEDQALARVPLL